MHLTLTQHQNNESKPRKKVPKKSSRGRPDQKTLRRARTIKVNIGERFAKTKILEESGSTGLSWF